MYGLLNLSEQVVLIITNMQIIFRYFTFTFESMHSKLISSI